MSDHILIRYQLSRDLWQQFYEAHYAADPALKIRYVWGGVCIVIGSLGLGGLFDSPIIAALLLATGFFGVLTKPIFIIKSVRNACKHPFYGQELTVSISNDEIAVRSDKSGYSQPWGNFVGYRQVAPGLILYHDKSAFFFIPATALNKEAANRLQQILDNSGLAKL